MEKFMCGRKIDSIGIETDIWEFLGLLLTNPFLVARKSIWRIHYGKRKVDKLSDFDKNWFPKVLRDYKSAIRFSKFEN